MVCGVLFSLYVAAAVSLLGHKPLWLDEIWQQLGTRNISFRGMVDYARDGAGGVLLPFSFQWGVLKIFPYSPAVSRLPALLFGIGSVVLSWFLARQVRVRQPAIAVSLVIVLPILFRYTLEARPYSQGVFFCCWSLLLLLQVDERPSIWRGLALVVVAAAALYSQPFAIFAVVAAAIVLAGTAKDRLKMTAYLILPVCASFLLYVPWYLTASNQWSSGFASAGPVNVFDAKLPLRVLREYTGGGYVVGVCFLVLALLGLRTRTKDRQAYVLAVGFAAGVILPLFAEQTLEYFYAARHLMFALPAGAVLCAFAFDSRQRSIQLAGRVLVAGILAASATTIAVKEMGPHEDWQAISNRLASLAASGNCVETVRPEGLIYYEFFRPSLKASACASDKQKRVVLVSDPYTPATLFEAQLRRMEKAGYEEAQREDVSGFRIARLLLRRDQAFANSEQNELRGAMNVHLLHQIRAVHRNGIHAQIQ